MLTPQKLVVAFRALLVFEGVGALALILQAPVSDGPVLLVRVGLIYALTLTAFAALPRNRRNDVALLIAGLACTLEAARAALASDLQPMFPVYDVVSVLAAWAPSQIEAFRDLARTAAHMSFQDIAALERRSSGRRDPDASVGPV